LGLGYSLNWQDAQAASLLEPAVEQSRRVLRNENPQTAALLALLGYTRVHILQLEAAEPPARESLEITRTTLGEENTRTIGRKLVLARIYLMKGEANQADPLIEDVLAMKPRVAFEDDPFIALHLSLLSMEYLEQSNLTRAALLGELAEETLSRKRDSNPLASPRILTQLGAVRLAQHRYTEAESLLRESLDLAERYWPEGEFRFLVMSLLGASLTGQQKHDEADKFLTPACAGLLRGHTNLPPFLQPVRRTTESLERLVQLYDASGKPAQAAEWKRKLAAFQQANKAAERKGAQP
jgi:tetratricopeptide (TPR) repeat protein